MSRLARWTQSAVVAITGLVAVWVFAQIIGAELGCGNWPVCGTVDLASSAHPLALALTSIMVGGAAIYGYAVRRGQPWVLRPTMFAGALLGLWLGLEWLVTGFSPSPFFAPVRLGLAMLIMAALLVAIVADRIGSPLQVAGSMAARRDSYPRLVLGILVASYGLILSGAFVVSANLGATSPDIVGLVHQVAMVAMGLMLVALVWATYRMRRGTRLVTAMLGIGSLFLVQAVLGLGFIGLGVSLALRVFHLASGVMVWSSLVVLAMLAYATPAPRRVRQESATVEATPGTGLKATIAAYVTLAKPRVISLLLLTTWAAMWVAAPTPPAWSLVFWTLLGGALSAGGANAINMFYDRDIDRLMGRTARRPLPSQRLDPIKALWFGIALGVLSFVILTVFVNLLSAVLALSGLLFYVFIYTAWLKRTSVQNIVIGGAAGAVPPLVGWAAVTGELSWVPIYMFIIVFFWTPPHFWALALVRQGDYSRAGVPMLPVVAGEKETYKQILIYSVVMVGLTLLLVPLGVMGWIYLVSAAGLGGLFIWDAIRLARQGGAAPAWRLYKYSLLYLALIFVAMVVDHMIIH